MGNQFQNEEEISADVLNQISGGISRSVQKYRNGQRVRYRSTGGEQSGVISSVEQKGNLVVYSINETDIEENNIIGLA